MKTKTPKAPRPTIKSLQAQLANVTTNRDFHVGRVIEEQKNVAKMREQRDELEKSRDRAQEDRDQARRDLHLHRAAVLEYFMVMANPETAKDVERVSILQAKISDQPYYATPPPKESGSHTPFHQRPRGY